MINDENNIHKAYTSVIHATRADAEMVILRLYNERE